MEALTNIQKHILAILLESHETTSSQSIANQFGVSSKTIRNNLAIINDFLKKNGAFIQSKTGKGYYVVIVDETSFSNFYRELSINVTGKAGIMEFSLNEERAHAVIRYLLGKDDFVKIDEIEEFLYINTTSVKNIISICRQLLLDFDLSLVSKSKYGFKIDGNEHNLRMLYVYEYGIGVTCNLMTDDFDDFYDNFRVDMSSYNEIKNAVMEYQRSFSNLNLPYSALNDIVLIIILCSFRNKKAQYLKYSEKTIVDFSDRNSYYIAKMILTRCEIILNTVFTSEDVILLSICLVANRVIVDTKEVSPSILRNGKDIAFEIVQFLGELNKFVIIPKNLELVDDISLNIDGLLVRNKYHVFSSYLARKSSNNLSLMSRKLAIQSLIYLHQKYDISIRREDVIRLANCIHPVFGRFPFHYDPVKGIIISDIDKSAGYALKQRLLRNFDRFFSTIDVIEYYELDKYDLNQYGVIFTSLDYFDLTLVPSNVRIVNIDTFFGEDEKVLVRELVTQTQQVQMPINKIFNERNFFLNVDVKSQEQVYESLFTFMSEIVPTDDSLVEDLVLTESIMKSEPINNTVIISGISSHCTDVFVGVMVLKRPISWNSKFKVQVIVYFDEGQNESHSRYFENEYLPHILSEVFFKSNVVDRLITKFDYEQLLNEIKINTQRIYLTGRSFN